MRNNRLSMLIFIFLLVLGNATFAVAEDTNDPKYKLCDKGRKDLKDGHENKVQICFVFKAETAFNNDTIAWRIWNHYDKPISIAYTIKFPNSKSPMAFSDRNIKPGMVRRDMGNSIAMEKSVTGFTVDCFKLGGGDCPRPLPSRAKPTNGTGTRVLDFPGPAKPFQTLDNPDKATPEQKVSAGQPGNWSKPQPFSVQMSDGSSGNSKGEVAFTSRWKAIGQLEFKFSNPGNKMARFFYVLELSGSTGKRYVSKSETVIANGTSGERFATGQELNRVIVCASRTECEKIVPAAFQ